MKTEQIITYNNKLLNELEKEIISDFILKFCNNHNGEIRFLRSVFFDEKDGAETIINFIKQKIAEVRIADTKRSPENCDFWNIGLCIIKEPGKYNERCKGMCNNWKDREKELDKRYGKS